MSSAPSQLPLTLGASTWRSAEPSSATAERHRAAVQAGRPRGARDRFYPRHRPRHGARARGPGKLDVLPGCLTPQTLPLAAWSRLRPTWTARLAREQEQNCRPRSRCRRRQRAKLRQPRCSLLCPAPPTQASPSLAHVRVRVRVRVGIGVRIRVSDQGQWSGEGEGGRGSGLRLG